MESPTLGGTHTGPGPAFALGTLASPLSVQVAYTYEGDRVWPQLLPLCQSEITHPIKNGIYSRTLNFPPLPERSR